MKFSQAFELATLKRSAILITFTDATGIEEAVVDYKGARIKLACYHTNTIVWACHVGDTAMLDVEKIPGSALRAAIRALDGHVTRSVAFSA